LHRCRRRRRSPLGDLGADEKPDDDDVDEEAAADDLLLLLLLHLAMGAAAAAVLPARGVTAQLTSHRAELS
jgi:hypothetical protein